jgi:hypothetical protein
LPQGLAFDIRHDIVEEAVAASGVEQGQNVRVAQAGGDLDLAEEALRADGPGQFRPEDLHGNGAMMLEVPPEEDCSHPATAEHAHQ